MYHQAQMHKQRQIAILSTLKTLQFATRRHLMCVHDMGGIRNANRIMQTLQPYTKSVIHNRERVYYLSKEGRALVDCEVTPVPSRIAHALLRNEAWLMLHCPDEWVVEKKLKYRWRDKDKTILPDAVFKQEGILNCVEVDRYQTMHANNEKLKRYDELTQYYKKKYNGRKPVIHFYTISLYRERKLQELARKYDVYINITYLPEV
ncbi:replication-relaxation family protein [Ectobacillus antri]|uniref:replication-relaxation family protein n=1 Tax=Ectobacillus antri TaxID=2486280 RepID=UPI000F5B02A6|nr:replication-relaxation family protein [Ectobacillus antri]